MSDTTTLVASTTSVPVSVSVAEPAPTTTALKVDIASMFGVSQQDLTKAASAAPTTRDFSQVTAEILGVQLPSTSTVPPTQTIAGSDTSVQVRTDLPPTLTTVLGTTSTAAAAASTPIMPPTLQTGGPSIHEQITSLDKKLDLVLQHLAGTSAITAAAVPAASAALSTAAATPKVGLDTGLSWSSIFPAKTGGRRRRGRTARRRKARGRTAKKHL